MNELTLITGGTGKTGRRVAERLTAAGHPVRIGSRSGNPAFDWDQPSTWLGALDGVDAAYLSYYPDLAVPGAAATVGAFARLAAESGVRRLVLLSGRGEEEAQNAEKLVADAGVEWTVVRCSWFNQNFDESYWAEPIAAGELAIPGGDVTTPFVDADDIADVAVAALTEDGHAGEIYELTGPRALSFAEAVAEISEATGRRISYVPITLDEFAADMKAEGLPDDVVWLLRYLFGEVFIPDNAWVADGVQRALGREPRDFRDFARDAAAAGAWKV
jgi:uncharacterized protein YbjT (DUF2867 family)